MRRRTAYEACTVLVAFIVLAILLGACGGSGGGGVTKTATNGKIEVGAHDIRFDVKTIRAAPGPLTVTLVEHGALAHTFKVEGTDFELKVDASKKRDSGTINLTAGTHDFECTVSGHAAQGMKGKIEVG